MLVGLKANRVTDRKQILILGASSRVGRHLFAGLGSHRAIATYRRNPIVGGVYFDSLSMRLPEIIKAPEAISHAVILLGDTKPDSCASDIKQSRAVNVESIKSILACLLQWGIKPVFTSTEVVFNGDRGDYIETDEVNPVLTYAMQKVEIEKYIQDYFEEFVIVRLALVFGATRGDGTLLTNWLDAIEKDQTSRCAYDYVCSPIFIDDVVRGMAQLIDSNCNGIFHLAGSKPFSRLDLYELLLAQVKKYLPVQRARALPCSIHDFDLLEKRPLNVSMRPDKFINTTKLAVTDVELVCANMVEREYQPQSATSIRKSHR